MKLSDLNLNRFLKRVYTDPSTLDAETESVNEDTVDNHISSGNSAEDVNTGTIGVNGEKIQGTIPSDSYDISSLGWNQTCIFVSSNSTTVNWGNGSFVSAKGDSYQIIAGSTGVMSTRTYVYLNINISKTEYQHSINPNDVIGPGIVLILVAINDTPRSTFTLTQNTQLVSDNIITNSLSSITANLGSITSGEITGVLFRTSTSGKRIEITSSPSNLISFYNDSILYGTMEVTYDSVSNAGYIKILAQDTGAGLEIDSGTGSSYFSSINMFGNGGSVYCNGNSSNSYAGLQAEGGAGTCSFELNSSGAGTTAIISGTNFTVQNGFGISLGGVLKYSWPTSSGVTAVYGTAPIQSSGGNTPYISLNTADSGFISDIGNILDVNLGGMMGTTLRVRRVDSSGIDAGWYLLYFNYGLLQSATIN